MATCFDRWEKDPFFSAAEEVQESTDRMESVYRRWMTERKETSSSNTVGNGEGSSGELLRELQTALGTAKWQLEVLEKAVRTNENACSAGEDTRTRHKNFFNVIGNQIAKVENSVAQSNSEDGNTKVRWVQLDDGERDELALFLALPPVPKHPKGAANELKTTRNQLRMNGEGGYQSKNCNLNEIGVLGVKEKIPGHRRTASANADIGSWNISVSSEDVTKAVVEQPILPLPKISSFSSLTKVLESTPKIKWANNGIRNWIGNDKNQASELIPLKNNSEDANSCYDRSKNCLDSCHNEYYDKQLHGWIGAFHRQLQRSLYHFQYGRPIQLLCWTMAGLLFLVLVALKAI